MRSLIASGLVGVVILSLAGCGGPKTYPVRGKVTLPGGKPLVGALVEFETHLPDGQRLTAHGQTGEDGSYELKTPQLGAGAVAGEHKVIVVPPSSEPGGVAGPPSASLVHKNFQSYRTTPLKFIVKPEGPYEFPIEVHGPPRR
jgi:hypothetical protein